MHLEQFSDINLEEYSSKKLSLPAVPSRYIETVSGSETWNNDKESVVYNALPFARTELLNVPIKSARILCQGDDVKKVIEIIFDLKDHPVDFLPGDTIGIQPINRDQDVNFLIDTLELSSNTDKKVNLSIMKTTQKKAAKLPNYLPEITTSRILLRNYLNIYSVPKKLFLRALVEFTDDKRERLLLQILCSKEGGGFYNQYVTEKGMTFLDLLKLCPSCKPPMGILIEHLPRLLPRPYSVANSSLKSPKELKIVFSVLTDESQKGLTTEMLEEMVEKFLKNKNNPCSVNLYFRDENAFKYTQDDLNKNIIMIGIGCGISPFVGFLEHKFELEKQLVTGKRDFKTWLFSGSRYCRNALFRKEICDFLEAGTIDEYFESYSREVDSEFKYVQDQIVSNAERFVNLLLCPQTKIYVCADGNEISKKIVACIEECIKSVCNLPIEEASDILKDMRRNARYIEDIWL